MKNLKAAKSPMEAADMIAAALPPEWVSEVIRILHKIAPRGHKKCAQCREEFPIGGVGLRGDAQFCSDKCRFQAYNQRRSK